MLYFGTRKSHDWHEKVNSTARRGGQQPLVSGALNSAFPWAELRLHTDLYLRKKGDISPEERDRYLLALIQKHGTMHIAVAACAHKMSTDALRGFMANELQTAQGIETQGTKAILGSNQVQFLKAIVTAHHANPLTFSESDSQVAQALIRSSASNLRSTSQHLETLVKLMITGIPSHSFAYLFVQRMVHGYAARFSNEMQALRDSCSWLKARAETEWLAMLLVQPFESSVGKAEAIAILSVRFPDWRIWAEWGESDTQLAQALDACQQPDPVSPSNSVWHISNAITSASRRLERLIKIQIAVVPMKNSFVYLDARKQTQVISAELSLQVQILKNSHQWLAAYKETEWFPMLLDPLLQSSAEASEVIELLGAQFPDWKAWAGWGHSDSQLAQTLCSALDDGMSSQKLKIMVGLLIAGVPSQSLLHSSIHWLTRNLSIELAQMLQDLRQEGAETVSVAFDALRPVWGAVFGTGESNTSGGTWTYGLESMGCVVS